MGSEDLLRHEYTPFFQTITRESEQRRASRAAREREQLRIDRLPGNGNIDATRSGSSDAGDGSHSESEVEIEIETGRGVGARSKLGRSWISGNGAV